MMILFLAAMQTVTIADSLPAPKPPRPFTAPVETEARQIAKRVSDAFARCDPIRTNATGRYVDAMGTPAHSPEWEKAKLRLREALIACQGLRQSRRDLSDFFQRVAREGKRYRE